jgi:hypothetical protein
MSVSVKVLLLDDGELDDVQSILDHAGVSYGRIRGGAIAPNTPPPSRLLIATPRRVDMVSNPEAGDGRDLIRIVIVNEDSTTLRARLREVGFDYLVRRPVHPEALRLLVLHCVYTGEERRKEPRVPVGMEVSFRTGLLPRRATLADLSTRGARLVSRWPLEPGKRINLTIPERAGIPRAVTLKGRVIRMSLDERMGDTPYSAAVTFESVPEAVRTELEWILDERALGPATLRPAHDPAQEEPGSNRPALDPPETRADDLCRDVSVEVDVRLEGPLEGDEAHHATRKADAVEIPVPSLEEIAATSTEPEGDALDEGNGSAALQGGAEEKDRRDSARGSYRRRIPAFGDRAMRVLVARDLSMAGLRVERETGLELGDRLHLAIYGDPEEEPFLVWATVERTDGSDGMYLAFDSMHPVLAQQLDSVVANLPAVESLHDDEARAMGTVVTEILNG